MKVAIIGGGAAGFFAAISCKQHHPEAGVTILEKSSKLLAKVKVSGGGRCNVTHACFQNSKLSKFYPRGEKQLKKAFSQFSVADTITWYESRGVKLKTEADNRMFPVTNNSQTIIDCLTEEIRRLGIDVQQRSGVNSISKKETHFEMVLQNEQIVHFDKVILAAGGSPKMSGFDWLKELGLNINPPVPSLFTFNMPSEKIKTLMGLSVPNALVRVQGTKLQANGPLLITHWGMSGPAILKLSSFGARDLNERGYDFKIQVNWLGGMKEDDLRQLLSEEGTLDSNRKISNRNPFDLPARLWEFLLNKIELSLDAKWRDLGKKNINRMINALLNDVYTVSGKTTFKEEFVTCGGINLQEISIKSMQSKKHPGLYFAGEVIDIDGLTGGFNFQAAWTTGFIAGKLEALD